MLDNHPLAETPACVAPLMWSQIKKPQFALQGFVAAPAESFRSCCPPLGMDGLLLGEGQFRLGRIWHLV